ncbi:hypothetical protein MLD38_028514 [Melastoma candidum]|uniref:Uncharacterized protein n=1 Tax=Melastoma candidum TaxID=119954 RepID=A0ACB9N2L1_9MYRT|nr:hypothetical protein MLD38_028514 [Melastoma candidum]
MIPRWTYEADKEVRATEMRRLSEVRATEIRQISEVRATEIRWEEKGDAMEGRYIRSRFTINPDRVYRMVMRTLNTHAGTLEFTRAGDEEKYKIGGGLISELRDPVLKAMAATKEFDVLDEIEEDAESSGRRSGSIR